MQGAKERLQDKMRNRDSLKILYVVCISTMHDQRGVAQEDYIDLDQSKW